MIASEINAMYKQMQQLAIVFADVTAAKRVTDTVRKRIVKFMGYLPLLHAVCNPGLRERHWILVRLVCTNCWNQIDRVALQISQNFESPMCPEPDTSLAELVSAGLMQYISRIEEVSITATKEFALEETLQRMQSEWNEICFEFLPYRDSDVSVLTGIEEIQGDICFWMYKQLRFLTGQFKIIQPLWMTTFYGRKRCTRRPTSPHWSRSFSRGRNSWSGSRILWMSG